MATFNIKNIKQLNKKAVFAHPMHPEFKVTIGFVGAELSKQILDKATVMRFDAQSGANYEDRDVDIFNEAFVKATILGWEGLTIDTLSHMLPIDTTGIEDLTEEVDFSLENAVELFTGNAVFNRWVSNQGKDLDSFRK